MTSFEQIDHASRTDVGVRRGHNQDAHAVMLATDADLWRDRGHVFMVADGMGAHAVGEMASEMACNIIPLTYHKHAVGEGIVAALQRAFIEANASIHERGEANQEFKGMGTTSTALVLRPDGAWIAHVGDSRAYRIRGGQVQQLSFDHSLLWEKARRRHVDPEDLKDVPSNVIVRSLGPESEVEADIQGPHPVEPGDLFLLCSDGLSGPLDDAEIGAVTSVLSPAEACQLLVDLTNLRGGPDNITVVIAKVPKPKGAAKEEHEEEPPPPKVPFYRRVPWPLWILLTGVLLAGLAATQMATKAAGSTTTFVLAAVAILTGLGSLGVYQFLENRRRAALPAYRPRTKIYRETDCRIDRALVGKMKQLEESLIEQAGEKKWEVDWPTHRKHKALAEQHLGEARMGAAFRELCKALLPLTEAFDKARGKEEAFKPKWDKSRK